MISYDFVPISSQKGILFFETPGRTGHLNHKNSVKRATFSDKWSPGGRPASGPPLASALDLFDSRTE